MPGQSACGNRQVTELSWPHEDTAHSPLAALSAHMWLKMLRNTPKAMWVTPRMTDIFILKELRKLRWLVARLQIWGNGRSGTEEHHGQFCQGLPSCLSCHLPAPR